MGVMKSYRLAFSALQRLLDALLIAGSLVAASLALGRDWSSPQSGMALVAIIIFLLIGQVWGLYHPTAIRSADDEFKAAFVTWALTCITMVVIAFLSKVSADYSRLEAVAWWLLAPMPLIYSRLLLRAASNWVHKNGRNTKTVGIAGASSVAEAIVKELIDSAQFRVQIAIYDDRKAVREGHINLPRSGSLDELVSNARRGALDYIFIALPMRAEGRIVDLTNRLADTTASVYVIPDLFIFSLMRARWTTLGALPMVSVYESPFDGVPGWVKRMEDLLIGSAFLLVAAIPMALIATALKISSRDSVLFRQQRYGLNGQIVRVIKFRTMTVSEDGGNVVQAKYQDPRITPIGRLLRATALDELPQLFNVLAGSMSLVGPRPHAVKVNEDFRGLIHGYMLRHKVKPGITGWAQVNGWHGDDTVDKMQKRLEFDLQYLNDWSLWFDIKILFMTVWPFRSRKSSALSAA
jgi:putative colanic acid biosysnthesis UDP-glucose lipid carrier transferase